MTFLTFFPLGIVEAIQQPEKGNVTAKIVIAMLQIPMPTN